MEKVQFNTKDDESLTVDIFPTEVIETIPDADMRFTLIILNDNRKFFVKGTKKEVDERLHDS